VPFSFAVPFTTVCALNVSVYYMSSISDVCIHIFSSIIYYISGLVTLDEMKAKRESAVQEHEKRIALEQRAREK